MSTNENVQALEPIYTVRQVSEWSAKSEEKVRQEIREKRLRAFRLGEVDIRVKHSDLLAWLESNPVKGPCSLRDPRRNGRAPTAPPRKASRAGRP